MVISGAIRWDRRLRAGPEGTLYCFGQQIALALLLPLLLWQL